MNQVQAVSRGFLVSVGVKPEIAVHFQYNPTTISDKRAINYATISAPGVLLPTRQYTQGGDRTISFSIHVDGLFHGPAEGSDARDAPLATGADMIARGDNNSILPELNKYRAFLYPQTDRWKEAGATFTPLYDELRPFMPPPRARLAFKERVIDCIVTEISIEETLFNSNLAPVRADVSVTIVELAPYENIPAAPTGAVR
ncbi:MAG: hypothetical protein ACRDL2_05120 [Gaiellaceae bacterium]